MRFALVVSRLISPRPDQYEQTNVGCRSDCFSIFAHGTVVLHRSKWPIKYLSANRNEWATFEQIERVCVCVCVHVLCLDFDMPLVATARELRFRPLWPNLITALLELSVLSIASKSGPSTHTQTHAHMCKIKTKRARENESIAVTTALNSLTSWIRAHSPSRLTSRGRTSRFERPLCGYVCAHMNWLWKYAL